MMGDKPYKEVLIGFSIHSGLVWLSIGEYSVWGKSELDCISKLPKELPFLFDKE